MIILISIYKSIKTSAHCRTLQFAKANDGCVVFNNIFLCIWLMRLIQPLHASYYVSRGLNM